MSHFAVMVIGDDIESQLQPYHEFECSGIADQYVQDVDRTEEARTEFAERTETRLRAPDGTLHSFFDERGGWRPEFSQMDSGSAILARRTYFVPEGYEKIEVPAHTVESFTDWASGWYGWAIVPFGKKPDIEDAHKYGWIELDAAGEAKRLIDRTNPNKKWDWWQVGGRWSNRLLLKGGEKADSARKADIDFDGMRDAAAAKAGERWDKAAAAKIAAGYSADSRWDSWTHFRDVVHAGNIGAARDAYHAQPVKQAVEKGLDNPWDGVDEYLVPRDDYVQSARDGAAVFYALVKESQWIARGTMGWFGMSRDEIDDGEWDRKVNEMLNGLPDDTRITIVDCHI
jgi:hypothetical protein